MAELQDPDQVDQAGIRANREAIYLVGLMGFALLFLFELVLWFSEHGGVLSVIAAVGAVRSGEPVIDIDKNGLWFPFGMLVAMGAGGLCRVLGLKVDLSNRGIGLLVALLIVGGSFALDEALGQKTITHYMSGHGYDRCEAGDWAHGHRKGRVWFADYVRRDVECRPRIQSEP